MRVGEVLRLIEIPGGQSFAAHCYACTTENAFKPSRNPIARLALEIELRRYSPGKEQDMTGQLCKCLIAGLNATTLPPEVLSNRDEIRRFKEW